jgi:hypothetical protein
MLEKIFRSYRPIQIQTPNTVWETGFGHIASVILPPYLNTTADTSTWPCRFSPTPARFSTIPNGYEG